MSNNNNSWQSEKVRRAAAPLASYEFDFGLGSAFSNSSRPIAGTLNSNGNAQRQPIAIGKPSSSSQPSTWSYSANPAQQPKPQGPRSGYGPPSNLSSIGIVDGLHPASGNPKIFGDLLGGFLSSSSSSSSSSLSSSLASSALKGNPSPAPFSFSSSSSAVKGNPNPSQTPYSSSSSTSQQRNPNPSQVPFSFSSSSSSSAYSVSKGNQAPSPPSSSSTYSASQRNPSQTPYPSSASQRNPNHAPSSSSSSSSAYSAPKGNPNSASYSSSSSASKQNPNQTAPPSSSPSAAFSMREMADSIPPSSRNGHPVTSKGTSKGGAPGYGPIDSQSRAAGKDPYAAGLDLFADSTHSRKAPPPPELFAETEGLPPLPPGITAVTAKGKGMESYRQGQFADAIQWLSWAAHSLAKRGDHATLAEVLTCRVSCYKEIGEYKKAVADCTRVLDQDGSNTAVLLQRGLLYESTEKYKLGVADLREVVRREPRNRVASNTLARLVKFANA